MTLILPLLLLLTSSSTYIVATKELQHKPNVTHFEAFWNVPSFACDELGFDMDPRDYGIHANEHQKNYGTEVVTFYEQFLGIYPHISQKYNKTTGETQNILYNGGIPQNVNLDDHLAKAAKDIQKAIPDPKFNGLAVIDYEGWRPLWQLNWYTRIVYRTESERHARQLFPYASDKSITSIAKRLFNTAAKKYMVETIRLLRRMRPLARVGFFDYPICNYDAGEKGETECVIKFDTFNQNLEWMYRESNALFPPIYLYKLDRDFEKRQRYIYAKVVMTKRVLLKMGLDLPIYVYTKFEYNTYPGSTENRSNLYTEQDLCNTMHYAAELGAHGAVFWSTSNNMADRCSLISEYINDTLKPFVLNSIARLDECSQKICNGNGECTLLDAAKPIDCKAPLQKSRYTCECHKGYMGSNCQYYVELIPTYSTPMITSTKY
jgi:hyaluronoglucosaminidase